MAAKVSRLSLLYTLMNSYPSADASRTAWRPSSGVAAARDMPSGHIGGEPSMSAAVAMCGPSTRPLATSTRCPIVSDIAVRLKTWVTPLAM